MRVSELAKELGYKAAELVELARIKGIKLEDARAAVDARMAAAVRAQVPHRSKLSGPLMEVYVRVVSEEASRAVARAAEPKVRRKKVETPEGEGGEPKPKRPPRPKAVSAAPKDEKKPAAAVPPKPARKVKVVEEFRLSDGQKTAPRPAAPKAEDLSPEEQEELKKEAAKPLIDVDRVIGQQKELHAMRPIEIEVFQRDKEVVEHKDRRVPRTIGRASSSSPLPASRAMPPRPPDMRRQKPRVPPAAMRSTVQPPRPRPVVTPIGERKIEITVPLSVKNFCEQAGIKVNQVIRKLMEKGAMITINHMLDEAMVTLLAGDFKRDITVVKEKTAEENMQLVTAVEDDPKNLVPRAPVVTFMGHVDHGKTSLLDRIRNTQVAAGEHGGITQHIGASKVVTKDGRAVVFLDTPGHEAFTQMRSRGAKATDVAVIVVDAADGVMPQTEEAISHAKAAGVKIVVALNKIDKPQANPNKVKGQLASLGLQPEDWGGQTVCVEVSALTGQNVDQLLEMLSLEADLLELRANPGRPAAGVVLEARKSDDRGVLATVLVQTGTLRKGDAILAGSGYGRVRSMHDGSGRSIHEAGPSTPVEVTGFVDVPDAGDVFQAVPDLSQAKELAGQRQRKTREAHLADRQHVTMETLFKAIESGRLREVRVVLKVDVKGSLEVLQEALPALSEAEVKLRLLHASVGAITEGDVLLADASDAIIIGFHVEVDARAAELAKERGVDVRLYTVIYQAIEEVKAALEGLLEPEIVEAKTGHAAVKEVFRISRVGAVAGCMVTDGKLERSNQVRLIRDGRVVHTGKLESLKRFKDDVKEVVEGYECGLKLAGHDDIRKGDVLEGFALQKIARKLSK